MIKLQAQWNQCIKLLIENNFNTYGGCTKKKGKFIEYVIKILPKEKSWRD